MRYALCLRGIHYYKDYMHDFRPGMTPYTIDFGACIPSLIENIIKPLEDENHEVDIFFYTYASEKLNLYVQELNPKKICTVEYNSNITKTDWRNVARLIHDSATLAMNYEAKYDYYILTRFDTIFLEKISNVYVEPNGVSVVTPRDDNFFIVHHSALESFLQVTKEMIQNGMATHECTKQLLNRGVRCHSMYSHAFDNNKYPFMRNMRYHINNSNHMYYLCDIQSVYDESSNYYGYFHKPCKEYNACY